MNLRPLFWMLVGAVATLAEGAWAGKQYPPVPDEPLKNVAPKIAAPNKTEGKPAPENSLRRTPWVKPRANPFGEKRKVTPRAVAPIVENREPPPLVFPFEYVGKLTADGKDTWFFSRGDQIYPVVMGGVLENLYRVERVGSDVIELSYLPDGRKLTVAMQAVPARHTVGAGAPRAIMNQPPSDPGEMAAELPEMLLPGASPSPEGGQQSASATPPAGQPPVLIPPGMLKPGMMQPGMIPPGMMPPGMMPQGATQ